MIDPCHLPLCPLCVYQYCCIVVFVLVTVKWTELQQGEVLVWLERRTHRSMSSIGVASLSRSQPSPWLATTTPQQQDVSLRRSDSSSQAHEDQQLPRSRARDHSPAAERQRRETRGAAAASSVGMLRQARSVSRGVGRLQASVVARSHSRRRVRSTRIHLQQARLAPSSDRCVHERVELRRARGVVPQQSVRPRIRITTH